MCIIERMDELEKFIEEIECWARANNLSRSEAGVRLASSPAFVHDLHRGREPRFSTIRKARERMQNNG